MDKTESKESKLYLRNKGILLLNGEINNETAEKTIYDILFLNENMPEIEAVQLIVNSFGGKCDAGFQIIDIIQNSKLPVYVLGLGICASTGINVLCAGEKGHRLITHNTSLLCHQYSWINAGKYHELFAARKQQDIENERLVRLYLRQTKLNKKQIEKLIFPPSDVWLKPEEAKKYGIVDKIIKR